MATTVDRLAWHIHHDRLVEILHEPLATRRRYIREVKPKAERALRLRLLKLIPEDTLLSVLRRAFAKYSKAQAALNKGYAAFPTPEAYDKACDAANTAWGARRAAVIKRWPALEKLHKQQCQDCPWDGRTIFSRKR